MSGNRRQVYDFLDFVREHEQFFDLKTLPVSERIPYQLKHRFFQYLEQHSDDFIAGDIVIIRGYAAWDHFAVPHSHTFFVYDSDPVTGMPTLLAGNAGQPRIRSWEPVMGRTPLRSIRHRVRPTLAWLERVVDQRQLAALPPGPPPWLSNDN
jgi:hypothetical protein